MRAVFAIAVCALVVAACDGSPLGPEPRNPTVSFGSVTPASVTASLQGCNAPALLPNVTLVVTAQRSNVFVDTVTIHMVDGSNIGGQSITFPRAGLDSLFGTTLVRAGSNRSFILNPSFACGSLLPRGLQADVTMIDASGARQTTSAAVSVH